MVGGVGGEGGVYDPAKVRGAVQRPERGVEVGGRGGAAVKELLEVAEKAME
jgi:hypothetical protein